MKEQSHNTCQLTFSEVSHDIHCLVSIHVQKEIDK